MGTKANDSEAPRVVVVGSINTDLVVTAERIVAPGETIAGTGFETGQGGKGANQASAAAAAGAAAGTRVAMVGCVGDDANGRYAVATLRAGGVDVSHIGTADAPTGVALIQVASDGENAITVVAGANARLSAEAVDAAFADIDASLRPAAGVPDDGRMDSERDVDASPDAGRHDAAGAPVLVLCLEIPVETVTYAAVSARARGWTVVLNPAPAPQEPLPRALLDALDVLVPNEQEAAALGRSGAMSVPAGCAVVVTRGAAGAVLFRQRDDLVVPAPSVHAADTTGAGDAFIGVLAVSLAEGRDLAEAVRRAVAGGAIATLKAGARGSLPTASAIDEVLQRR
ncbi:ribokinase [Planctomonas sp. JC2975]|nr:ribokinase [Planctomonas sp. JC2975]